MRRGRIKELVRPAAVIALVWLVLMPIVTSGNIRMDSDRMIHSSQTALDQYIREGRDALVCMLHAFGLTEWHPFRSGILFLIFFSISCLMVYVSLRRFRGWNDTWYPELFLLLYGLSPIWAYHGYFVLQIAAIGFGMMLTTGTACIDARLMAKGKGNTMLRIAWHIAAAAVLCFAVLIYQSLIICYATVILMLAFCILIQPGRIRWAHIIAIVLRLAAAVAGYLLISRALGADMQSGNMAVQIHWGLDSAEHCLYRIAMEIGADALMYTSRCFSLYTLGIILMAVILIRRKRAGKIIPAAAAAAGAGLALIPFAMSFLLGNVTVPRSQFALQLTAAFFPVCYMARTEGKHKALKIICMAAALIQAALILRLYHTDQVRNEMDVRAAARISDELDNTDTKKPLIFTGVLKMEDDSFLTEKSDVYGKSFFEWIYVEGNPFSVTQPAIRLLNAYNGKAYSQFWDWKRASTAMETAQDMPSYPDDGFVRETDNCIVVKLSE